jgi:hypothetical protein
MKIQKQKIMKRMGNVMNWLMKIVVKVVLYSLAKKKIL